MVELTCPSCRYAQRFVQGSTPEEQARNIQSIILVTSALHMPRSVGVFEHQGLQVIPAPTDYYVTQAQGDQTQSTSLINKFYDLLPSVENLSLTSRVMKEYIGLFVYRLRGWL